MFASYSARRAIFVLATLCTLTLFAGCASRPSTTQTAAAETTSPSLLRSLERTPREAMPLGTIEDGEVLRIAVVSDLNGRYGSTEYGPHVHSAVRRLKLMDPDIILSSGDMVAGQKKGLDYDAMWEAFHTAVSDPLAEAGIPFAISPGNHDASAYEPFAEERERYAAAWEGRKPDLDYIDDEYFPFRYAFMMDGTLFVALDATTAEPMDPEQKEWLDAILTQHEDIEQKIVFGHVPIYPFAERKETDVMDDPELEALLNRHHVTMFVSGHHQAYYPGRRGELRMVGTGCLGGGVRTLLGEDQPSDRTIVLIEIDKYGVRRIEGLAGDRFDTLLARENLPEHLGHGDREIIRDDVGDPGYIAQRMQKMAADGLAYVPDTELPPPVLVAGDPTIVAQREQVRPRVPLSTIAVAAGPEAAAAELAAALDGAAENIGEPAPKARPEIAFVATFGERNGGMITAAVRGLGEIGAKNPDQWEYRPTAPAMRVVTLQGPSHERAWADPSLALSNVTVRPAMDLATVIEHTANETIQQLRLGVAGGRDRVSALGADSLVVDAR